MVETANVNAEERSAFNEGNYGRDTENDKEGRICIDKLEQRTKKGVVEAGQFWKLSINL